MLKLQIKEMDYDLKDEIKTAVRSALMELRFSG
jgi:hypothetical protein